MLDSVLLYAALTAGLAGLVSIAVPLRFIGLRTRRSGAILLGAAIVVAIVALALPVTTKSVTTRKTMLDIVTPEWQFAERHTIVVDATAAATMRAVRTVPAREIHLFAFLTAVRRGGRAAPASILNAPPEEPLLDVALRNGFFRLMDAPDRETVVGCLIAASRTTRRPPRFGAAGYFRNPPPGVTLATMNFVVEPDGPTRTRLTTETRVYSNTPALTRQFAVYWRIIHPGSDIIRRMWLRAIKQRAEGEHRT